MPHVAKFVLVVAALACSQDAFARSSDRSKEMLIDAGATSGTLDDRQPTVLSGGVTIRQGTLDVRSSTATVTTRNGDPVRAVLKGAPVRLTQEMDDGTPMTATGNNVDYDLVTEVVVFTGNVNIEQPRGSLKGERVVYNMRTGQVNSGGPGQGRVQMRIAPRASRGGN